LVEWDHVPSLEDLHESKVSRGLDLAVLVAVIELEVFDRCGVELLLAGPLKSLSPSLVSEPVANEIGISGIDQYWDLCKNVGDKTVEWLHPISSKQEVSVDIEVARVIPTDFNTKSRADLLLVQVFADPAKGRVAKIAAILALAANVVHVLASLLVWTNHSIVTVNACRHALPDTFAVVASLNERLATWKSVCH